MTLTATWSLPANPTWWDQPSSVPTTITERSLRLIRRLFTAPIGAVAVVPRPEQSVPDEDLLRRASQGDDPAFDELFRRHADWVFRRLTRLVGPVPEREDLVQEVFFGAYRGLARWRGEATFSTWLFRIVANVACSHLRSRSRHRLDYSDLDHDLADPAASPEAQAATRQQLAQTLRHLERIKPKKRIAFMLRVAEGLSLDEIADIVGARPAAVGQRIKHAHQVLQAMNRRSGQREMHS